MIQSRGFLGRLLVRLLKARLPLMKNRIKPLAKSVLIALGLTAAAWAAYTGILQNIWRSGTTTQVIWNDETEGIVKKVKSLEDFGSLSKGVSKTIQNEAKERKGGFLSMLLGTLGASLLGNILASKGMNRGGEGFIRAGYGFSIKNKDF